jgi:hypothetical protein
MLEDCGTESSREAGDAINLTYRAAASASEIAPIGFEEIGRGAVGISLDQAGFFTLGRSPTLAFQAISAVHACGTLICAYPAKIKPAQTVMSAMEN